MEKLSKKIDNFDKHYRQLNIIVKGLDSNNTPRHKITDLVDNFMTTNFIIVCKSGNIIKAMISLAAIKSEIMRRKKTLGAKKVYVEHDRTPEERTADYEAR